jgi:hypothetical protein
MSRGEAGVERRGRNQQERRARKPAKALAVAGSWAFRVFFGRHVDRGAALLQPKVAALKHVSNRERLVGGHARCAVGVALVLLMETLKTTLPPGCWCR